jgi:hypothetical protein
MKTFSKALCERIGCSGQEYLQVALKHCLHPQPLGLHHLFAFFPPATDLRLLENAGAARTEADLKDLLLEYRQHLNLHRGFLARRLKLRVSSSRLNRLFGRVMNDQVGTPKAKTAAVGRPALAARDCFLQPA